MVRRWRLVLLAALVLVVNGCAVVEELSGGGKDVVRPVGDEVDIAAGASGVEQGSVAQLVAEARERYEQTVEDYQCRMSRRERRLGLLGGAEEIDVKFLDEPFSVFFHWRKNPGKADKLLYVAGEHDGQMMVAPVLIGWLTGPVAVDPHGREARQSSKRSVTEFGFANILARIYSAYETGKLGDGDDFVDSDGGEVEVRGRRALAIERRRVGDGPGDGDTEVLWRFCLDVVTLMPIAVTSFNSDGKIVTDYLFSDIRFNTGLTEEDFTLEAVGMAKGKK